MYWLIFILLAIVLGVIYGFGTFVTVLGVAVLIPLGIAALFIVLVVIAGIAYAISGK
jgi:hypothetical protein